MSGAKLSPLSEAILRTANAAQVFAPSQVQSWETSDKVLRQCHNLVHYGYLRCVRKGTAGNFSRLIPYRETLFTLNGNPDSTSYKS